MIFGILVLITALSISAVAIYYSVSGLVAIFAAAAVPIIIMGTVLEIGKLVTAVWLHKYWKQAKWWLKTYLSIATVILMFITSMGIFGFLSKAHIEQTSAGQESVAQVERLAGEIQRQNDIIKRAEDQIKKLETSGTGNDANIQSQIDKEQERIDNAYKRIQPAINEQQKIIDSQATLYKNELAKIDNDLATLQGYIDSGETRKAQQMIGASADGIFGKKTADKIGDWQKAKQAERLELIKKIEEATNNPQAKAAANEIKRLRQTVETQITQSNTLINRLRSQLGNTDKAESIDEQVDAQNTRIKNANTEIDKLTEEKYALEGEYRKLEAEVGPIKYIAEFIYGEQADNTMLEEAVRWVIIVIIFVFDPLAVLLLIASQYTFEWRRQGGSLPPKSPTGLDPEYEQARAEKIANNPGFQSQGNENDRDLQASNSDADATVGNMVSENDTTDTDKSDNRVEQDQIQDDESKVEPTLSKKKTDQYLLWPDIDPDPQESITEEIIPQKNVDPNQFEFDFDERLDGETEEEYIKRIWKKSNPGQTIELQKKLKDLGLIKDLPWNKQEVDNTIEDMKSKGQWPDQASQESQDSVSEQLEKIDDLDSWNNWVEKANEEAEKNPELPNTKAQYTEVIEPQGFTQNSEQHDASIFKKINQARKDFDPEQIKSLEISEEQYRDASQKHIISLIQRLKKGLINVDDLTQSEADKITKLLEKK